MTGRILHFSDVHFGAENTAAVAAALDYAHATPRDLVLITGDVTQKGRRREFEGAAAWIAAMPAPVFVVPGNHDTPYWDLIARLAWPWRRFETLIGHPAVDHQFVGERLAVRGVNTARGAQLRANWSKGVIDLEQTRRAADALAAAPAGALRVLACHHPLLEMIGGPMTGEVKRGREAAQIFAEAGVDLVMTGHVHVPFALPIAAGDHCSYAVGAGTLSLRERGQPAGFNSVEWTEDAIHVTALAWTGSRFEARRTWNLERRKG
ncbi:metallophosphoesterase [Caulobacter sp. 17J65-9]|uniref:metallophosphoesterase family protein n=1 Tax=Caulobacter sp. 17J65-9 TaxID=2709382 RepID=UPI0013CC753C|nr:metallophosphoesterase [Caulobacter sp. 17J65-9]NEX92832.1 metallophosphoesterase [Caulobacter sp. 17J65-9]